MKNTICTAIGVIGGFIANALGGWDPALTTLGVLMLADYLSGIVVAGVFHKSKKTESGSLKSWIGFKGICKQGMMLLIVLVGHQLDKAVGVNLFREGLIFGFMANECLSIIENAGLMGIPLPEVFTKAVDVLTQKSNSTKPE